MILVDAHVHIHAGVEMDRLLSAAHRNLSTAARQLTVRAGGTGHAPQTSILALAEQAGTDQFGVLHKMAKEPTEPTATVRSWTYHRTGEPESLIAAGPAQEELILISGRQLATAERMEVLALGTREVFTNGTPLLELLAQVNRAGALAVIPWGFGKWSGRRGKYLKEALSQDRSGRLYLGDNGGRPWFLTARSLFELAEEKGTPVIPGSDPLPLKDEELRVGLHGFALQGEVSRTRPAAELKQLLIASPVPIRPFGRRENLGRFLLNQIRLRLMS